MRKPPMDPTVKMACRNGAMKRIGFAYGNRVVLDGEAQTSDPHDP